jgi:hypothetical protein
MVVGTVFLAALALVAGEQVTVPRLLETWLAFWYLVLIGTVAVFLLFLFVLPALGTSYAFVLTPFVTVAIGVWLAHGRSWSAARSSYLACTSAPWLLHRELPCDRSQPNGVEDGTRTPR